MIVPTGSGSETNRKVGAGATAIAPMTPAAGRGIADPEQLRYDSPLDIGRDGR
jgi:hypothetical protein